MSNEDFLKVQEKIQSKLRGISALITNDTDIQLALLEIKQMGKEEGRVEGAKAELENILNWLELCSKGKNRVSTLPLIKIGLCKDVIDKRLGELLGGKE